MSTNVTMITVIRIITVTRIFGHGTLSGDFLPHPRHADPPLDDDLYWTFHPIDIVGTKDTSVEGITMANSPFHTLMLVSHPP